VADLVGGILADLQARRPSGLLPLEKGDSVMLHIESAQIGGTPIRDFADVIGVPDNPAKGLYKCFSHILRREFLAPRFVLFTPDEWWCEGVAFWWQAEVAP
jgi:hypothetical protein